MSRAVNEETKLGANIAQPGLISATSFKHYFTRVMADYQPVTCLINPDNIIIDVNQAWDCFAQENDSPAATRNGVSGKSIFDLVSGKITKQYWRVMLERAWLSAQPLSMDYRCDSPDTKRWMRMELCRMEDGNMRIIHTLLASEKRLPKIHFRLAQQRSRDTHVCCSMCNRIKAGEQWCEAESLFPSERKIGGEAKFLPVIYGLCADCGKAVS